MSSATAPADSGGGIRRLLASAISYGVRTPLHALLGFLELLATTNLDADQRRCWPS
jgi:signal transduction histidine kinase